MSIKDLLNKQKTEPPKCGGTDTSQDPDAPKEIASKDMFFFSAFSALQQDYADSSPQDETQKDLEYVSVFAALSGEHTFMFLETAQRTNGTEEKTRGWAYVKNNVFGSLVKLVREQNIARNNGYHSTTHGLPENFGGEVDIRYASGEKISFSDNGCPVLSQKTAAAVVKLFTEEMRGERVELPDVCALKEICFKENRKDGGFTKAVLTINSDGTGVNARQSRYGDTDIYQSEKTVDARTVEAIKKNIENTGILAWSELPDNGFSFGEKKEITFGFSDGAKITVKDQRLLPDQIARGFFNIELEMITKN